MYVLCLNYTKNLPIILKLMLMLSFNYYAQNHERIIHTSLMLRQLAKILAAKIFVQSQGITIIGSVIILNNGGSVEIIRESVNLQKIPAIYTVTLVS